MGSLRAEIDRGAWQSLHSDMSRPFHRHPPAQADLGRYFGVTPPTVHQMLLMLERRGLLRRTPGQARAIEVLVPPQDLPLLL